MKDGVRVWFLGILVIVLFGHGAFIGGGTESLFTYVNRLFVLPLMGAPWPRILFVVPFLHRTRILSSFFVIFTVLYIPIINWYISVARFGC